MLIFKQLERRIKEMTHDNPQEAFGHAIKHGYMTKHSAGDFMYMYTKDGSYMFKSIATRQYSAVPKTIN